MGTVLLPVLAIGAGLLSFSSPCCLPLIPSYLSYVTAIPVTGLDRQTARRVTARAALGFVAGFTVIFTVLGVSFALIGAALLRRLPLIVEVSGVAIIAMGLASIGVLRIPVLARERRFDLARVPPGPGGAVLLGIAFAFGWTPCIGPVLATILATAAASQSVAWGGVLLVCYSVGLGVPFVALGLWFYRARRSLRWLQRHGRGVERISGTILVGVGVLFVTGEWRRLFVPLQHFFSRWGWPPV